MSEASQHLSFRDRLGQRLISIIDRIDPPATVKKASSFEEFRTLSRSTRADHIVASIYADEVEPGKFKLSASASSWRGDEADKSCVTQDYQEVLRGNPEDFGGIGLMTRLAFTTINGVEGLRGIRMNFAINRIDQPPETGILDKEFRQKIKDFARERGLVPLTPVTQSAPSPQSAPIS